MLGTRDPNKPEVRDWLRENPTAAAGTFDQAAKFGELVVLATLGRAAAWGWLRRILTDSLRPMGFAGD